MQSKTKARNPAITFSVEDKGFWKQPKKVCAKLAGKLIAIIAVAGNRHYWYAMHLGPDEPPYNTLSITNSATTLEGCKQEIRDFYKTRS